MRKTSPLEQIITYRIQLYVIEVKLAEALPPLRSTDIYTKSSPSTVGFLELENCAAES